MISDTGERFIAMMEATYAEKYLYKNYYYFENTEVDPETKQETRTYFNNIVSVGEYILNNPGKVIKVISGWRDGIPGDLMIYTITYDGNKIIIDNEIK